ncbi:MAG TPA: class II aldolase/adducin family protein [Bdellovibrionota bacterium]|nr:class II aldolase/adducin family protein [Bdellovibrionota bacterium]
MEPKIRKEILEVCKRLYRNNFVANHDGNVTARLSSRRILATPTAQSKWDISDEMLIVVDNEGKVVAGRFKPFSELKFHLEVYRQRPEVMAVVHAHPPYAMALSCSDKSLSIKPFPEAIVSLGTEVPLMPFAIPGSKESAEVIIEGLQRADALLLSHNGVLAVGASPLEAYYRLELVEHLARISSIAGKELLAIPDLALEQLLQKRAQLGSMVRMPFQKGERPVKLFEKY